MPATLWCDLFALTMMFNDEEQGCILIQLCYAEMKEGGDTAQKTINFASNYCHPNLWLLLKLFHPSSNPNWMHHI
jgi:hypothetical protein